jgi:predicted transglutaminase-like cysteine proteinase
MASLTALVLVILLYVFPINIVIYKTSQQAIDRIMQSQQGIALIIKEFSFTSYMLEEGYNGTVAFLYVINVVAIFLLVYVLFRFILERSLYVFLDKEIDIMGLMRKYSYGQRHINAISNLLIALILALHLIFRVFDVRILVLGILCIMYIYINMGDRKKVEKRKEKPSKADEAEVEEVAKDTLSLQWSYNLDPLSVEQPVRFFARVNYSTERYSEYQQKEHLDNSPAALRNYVLQGLCPEITDLANQIKAACSLKNFTTFHVVSTVMALQQSLKYVYDVDSKGFDEYIRYPLETLVDKEGDCDCHSICSAALLYSMGYEVVLLRIMFPEGDGHLALAVEGAEGIPGNFFELRSKKYYYCEVTPPEDNSAASLGNSTLSFRVGEMPEMPGANITVVPVKEIVKLHEF